MPDPQDWGEDGYWDSDESDESHEIDEALQNCGQVPHLGGGCLNAGTEYCDFECPYRDTDLPKGG